MCRMEVLFPTQLTGLLMITTSFGGINRPENKKDRYQSFLRAIDTGSLDFFVQFFLEPTDFLLIVADTVNLYTTEYTDADAAADQDARQQPCKLTHPTSPSLRPRLYPAAGEFVYQSIWPFRRYQGHFPVSL